MSFLKQLAAFFESFFPTKKPESLKQQQLKKIELDLSKKSPPLCKNHEAQPVIAEAILILYTETRKMYRILDFMGSRSDVHLKNRMYDILIQTGYTEKTKVIFESLSYELRIQKLEYSKDYKAEIKSQENTFTELQKELESNNFKQIEETLKNLELLHDLSNFNFIPTLRLFNSTFDPIDLKNIFISVPLEKLSSIFLDLYYLTANLNITASLARAVIALTAIVPGKKNLSSPDELLESLKKISGVLNKILTTDTLKKIIVLSKNDVTIEPVASVSKSNPLEEYLNREQSRFQLEGKHLSSEFKDRQIDFEIEKLFGDESLASVAGYNSTSNEVLKEGTTLTFLWVKPLQILKTFIILFFDERVESLLNDILLEGFFKNPEYKTAFSSIFFSCVDTEHSLLEFEQSFSRGEKNDIVLLLSYLKDSKKALEFSRPLTKMVNSANLAASDFVQGQISYFYSLHKVILQLTEDAHKTSPELISNIKFIFNYSRNKSKVEFLEKSLPKWTAFLNLMKNYVTIGQVEISREESRQEN